MANFYIKAGDTDPDMVAILKDPNGAAYDLTSASVMLHMSRKNRVKINSEATVTDSASGTVTYSWAVGDTDLAGPWDIEWQITWADTGEIVTVPNDGHDTVEITKQLA